MSSRSLFVLMQELPLEATGGGLLLRELLRHLVRGWSVTAICPSYPHQNDALRVLLKEVAQEHVSVLPMPVAPDWGTLAFTIRRQFSTAPGTMCALRHTAAVDRVKDAANRLHPQRWLLISPFAAAYLPQDVRGQGVCLYYTNIDDNIIATNDGSVLRRWDGRRERQKVRRFIKRFAGRVGRSAAITDANATDLSHTTARKVVHVPPLMAPRAVSRNNAAQGLALITTNHTYWHNRVSLQWFFREVWPRVNSDIHLEVTGLDTSDRALAALCASEDRVSYLGFLPKHRLDECFERCSFAVNPTISGSGFQIKILDALARGVPIVSTRFGNPLTGAIPSSDDPAEFASNIRALAGNQTQGQFDYQEFYAGALRKWSEFLN